MVHFAAVSYDQFDQYKILICPSTELCNAAEFHGNNPTTEWDQIFPLTCKPEATCELMILDVPFREIQSHLSLEQQNQHLLATWSCQLLVSRGFRCFATTKVLTNSRYTQSSTLLFTFRTANNNLITFI